MNMTSPNTTQPLPEGASPDVKLVRSRLLQALKEQLARAEGGEGGNIRGLHLFFAPPPSDRQIYESAIYLEEEGRFRNEIQRIADDYALDLPAGWTLETAFVETLPAEALAVSGLPAALFVRTRQRALATAASGRIRVLNGEAEQEEYLIRSEDGRINIGREKKVQGADGFFRINHIAFPSVSMADANRYVSREHAHIRFDAGSGQFLLFADEGGVPPRNKIKIRPAGTDASIKLQSTQVGHALQPGDQIMLGESALLEWGVGNNE